ncbi:restriction endonuclease subunit S [Pseudomonas aeruginosa]|uniref:restriction endonuclease subunit S n=2 Tax=Pseudomonas aeruginosa TaxID=287 RepID=UPI000BFE2FDB|nr:restriction endonuclease subunit S [Pseudomonas aeruginosa]MDG9835129.1 restriction endonuclease subunit S [Pseudomonas aeruginosa]MDH0454029.1 restriction endonuclease subunit S [Pseudomonas aeruginosa]MDH0587024.1 restriction endonuclease subunit S [Pseudomonas aeruginosa]NQA21717.1 restriction endonuclease subunit S [Pseudomonas aeruginosa]PHI22462.1 restriction endonuclease subunit S [Pseudomonas aeruginosa]
MANKWRKAALSELTVNHDGKRKPVKGSDRRPGPYPYYGASGIVDYVDGYLFDGDYLLIAEDGENLRTRRTPIAFMARGKSWVNNHAHIVTGNDKADTRFLMYAVEGTDISGYLTGAVMPKLTQGNLNKIELDCPPLIEQHAIAHILGTLDDKIELNRKQNETLEAMARALFKAWFVDFEPVRAKLEGRWQRGQCLPGLPAHLYELFPDRLVESDLGEIPEGWEISTLGAVCTYLNRGISPKYIGLGGVSVLNQKCIRDFSIDFSKARRHDAEQKKVDGRALELGDVLVNSTGVGTLGRVAQVRRLKETTIVDSHVTVVRSGSRINPMFLGCFMSMKQSEIEAMGEGSTGQTELSRTKLGELKILLPTPGVLERFSSHTKTFSETIAANQENSETLAQLRDALLPKLISGELRFPNAERIVGVAV